MKGCVAACEDRANNAEAHVRKTLGRTYKLSALVEVLSQTVRGKHECVAGLVDAELVRVRSLNNAARSECEGMDSELICDCMTASTSNGLLMRLFRRLEARLLRLPSCLLYDLFFCLSSYQFC